METNQSINRDAENFSLKDFYASNGKPLEQRLEDFADATKDSIGSGEILYRRKVQSKMDREVEIIDPCTGAKKPMLMFGSNNYLGLATHPVVLKHIQDALNQFGNGTGGPPLLNGYNQLVANVENEFARLKKTEDCLLTGTGYMANLCWINGLVCNNDVIFFDEKSHSSVYFGLSSVRCKKIPFRHNDLNDLEKKLIHYKYAGDRYLLVEGIYSMDGDFCQLPELINLSEKYEVKLVIDDAHGTGVIGKNGGGITDLFNVDKKVFLHVGTCSKALASIGGFLAGSKKLINYLRYMAGPYMFTAAAPPPVLGGLLGGLAVIRNEPHLRENLHDKVNYFTNGLKLKGIETQSQSPIIPIIIKKKGVVKNLNIALHKKGLFVNSILYPAVPDDKERLRISLMCNHTGEDLDFLLDNLATELKIHGVL